MKTIALVITGVLALTLFSCSNDEENINEPIGEEGVELTYDFEDGDEGWNAALIEFPVDDEELYDFDVEQTTSPVDEEEGALALTASNPNGKLIMYASKQISGLEPMTQYQVSYSIDVASIVQIDTTLFVEDTTGIVDDTTGVDSDTINVDTDDNGIYTAFNDTVFIKAGAISEEPATETTAENILEFIGIDIGEPGVDGVDLVVIGSFSADTSDTEITEQALSNTSPITVTTNEDGDLWLLVGTESFGSETEVYLNSINVVIEK